MMNRCVFLMVALPCAVMMFALPGAGAFGMCSLPVGTSAYLQLVACDHAIDRANHYIISPRAIIRIICAKELYRVLATSGARSSEGR